VGEPNDADTCLLSRGSSPAASVGWLAGWLAAAAPTTKRARLHEDVTINDPHAGSQRYGAIRAKQAPAPRKKAHCKKNIDSSSPFRPKQVDKIQRKIPIAKLSAKLPVSIFWEILWSSLGRLSVVENHVHFEVGEILYLLQCALLFGEGDKPCRIGRGKPPPHHQEK
jgi:hypothetical protein